MTNDRPSIKGDLLITLAMLIFGAYALFLKLLPEIPVISFLFMMQVVGMVAFFVITLRKGFPKTTRLAKWLLLALAITTTANDLTYFYAFRLTTVANASVAHQLVSIFLLFLAPLLLKEQTKKKEWISVGVAFAGIVLLFASGLTVRSHDALGIALGVFSALCYALFVLIYRYLPSQGYPVSFMNFWRYTLSTAMLFPLVSHFGGFGVIRQNIWKLTLFGLLFAVIASGIHNLGLSRTRALHSSVIGKSEPVIATAYAFFFLHQVPTLLTLIGGTLIVGASVWLAFETQDQNQNLKGETA